MPLPARFLTCAGLCHHIPMSEGMATGAAEAPGFREKAGTGTQCAECNVALTGTVTHRTEDGRPLCPACHHTIYRRRPCVACGTLVTRKDCHRNRYGEYICRSCQAAGIKHSVKGPLRKQAKKVWPKLINALFYVVLGLLAIKLVLSVIER